MAESDSAATAAIQFAVQTTEGIEFLRCWQEGDFAAIRRDWPDAPPGVFEGVEHPRLPSDVSTDSRAACGNGNIDMRALGELLLEAARRPNRGGGW